MNKQSEDYIHFNSCISSLNRTWSLLKLIQSESGNPLVGPAFRFALIEYCKPYKISKGSTGNHRLDARFIPPEHLPLHRHILAARDQVHAHFDLIKMQAELHVNEYMGQKYSLISQNVITGVEDLPRIQEVIALVEATLDVMYEEVKVRKAQLPL